MVRLISFHPMDMWLKRVNGIRYSEYQDAYDHMASLVTEIRYTEGIPNDLLQSLDQTPKNIASLWELSHFNIGLFIYW